MEQSSTTTQKKSQAPAQRKIRCVSFKTAVDIKTRKESYVESKRFEIELAPDGVTVRDDSKACITLVPFSNINYIQIEE